MPPLSRAERAALCNTALELGPDAPTLCEGWDVTDLVVHLLVRERDPIAAVGIAVAPLSGLTRRKSRKLAEQDFTALVERVRTGPPVWSPFVLPPVDRLANGLELFIHHEDLRRAQPGWSPRELPEAELRSLWRQLGALGKAAVRPAGVPVEARWGERRTTLARGADPVLVSGDPAELALALSGRREHRADLDGPPDAVALLRESLGS